ncbi:MAG: alanine racemase [Desulfobulbaceae bacterium]|nr:alanine racemase [Desulfobulbaceae bacterium]
MFRKTEALIDLDAIRENYSLACALAPRSRNIAVIKADAYGHGILAVAEALQSDVPAFAVAIIDEAIELREAGITVPLLVLEGVDSTDAIEIAVTKGLSLVVHCEEQVSLMQQARLSAPVSIWLKVDTGMHRLGLPPTQLATVIDRLADCACDVSAICTHLACADDLASDATREQIGVFLGCTSGQGLPLSIANSAGILAWPESHADWNRPGYMLYGDSPMASDIETAHDLRPAMTLRSEIIAIREIAAGAAVGYGAHWQAPRPSRIATVACGYADGYPRHAPNGTPTLVNGHVAPLVGAVSMDMITVDLTEHENVVVGDSVELWGRGVSVNDVATRSGTIGYELLTGVTQRVPRKYSA